MDDLLDEAEDVLRVVFAVGVVGDAGALVGGDLVLVDDPVEGGAIAEAVIEAGGRDAGEGEWRSERRFPMSASWWKMVASGVPSLTGLGEMAGDVDPALTRRAMEGRP